MYFVIGVAALFTGMFLGGVLCLYLFLKGLEGTARA